MQKNVSEKLTLSDKIHNLFASKADKKVTPKMLAEKAEEIVVKLNKANGKFWDNASTIKAGGKEHDIKSFFKDMSNYLDDFTEKAAKSSESAETFVESFHKKAKQLRYATNIMAVGALSAFLAIIPKIYQTGKTFPGSDGLKGEQPTNNNAKEVA